jgi:hypothetical protein
MRITERKIYWNQEEDPKQEGKDDCKCQCNLVSSEEEEEEQQQQQIDCNHK